MIPEGTTIGKIHIIRIKVNINKSVSPKAYDKAMQKMMFPKGSIRRTADIPATWEGEMRHEEDLDQEREKSEAVQHSIL